MGRTPTPLVIWVDDKTWPDWADLAEKGHQIHIIPREGVVAPPAPDLIVCEEAHFWGPGMKPYREAALKRARARRRS